MKCLLTTQKGVKMNNKLSQLIEEYSNIYYPTNIDFKVTQTVEFKGQFKTVTFVDTEALNEARKEYGSKISANDKAIREALFEYLDIENNPRKDLLFSKAWELGHSSGWESVISYAEDLVDLIQ